MKEGINPAALGALLKGDLGNFLTASTPGGIEAQEAAGQKEFVGSETLPKKMLHGCDREKLESMGIVFGEDADDIFVNCQLPEGWKKVPTEHSMWSELIDDKGRKRASIFYKAAFYDRIAHISLDTRFHATYMPEDDYKTDIPYEERQAGCWYGVVRDCGNVIYRTEPLKNPMFEQQYELADAAQAWLEEKYPDWKDPLAYWD